MSAAVGVVACVLFGAALGVMVAEIECLWRCWARRNDFCDKTIDRVTKNKGEA